MMSDLADVPTIDISPLRDGDGEAKARAAAAIDRAIRGSGFFYAAGHGIDVQRLQAEVNRFHRTMTEAEKLRIAIRAYNPANVHIRNGYYMAIEGKKPVESFCYLNPSFTADHPMIRGSVPMHEVNWWPDEATHPTFRAFCERYFQEVLELSRLLLRGFSLALGRPEGFFDRHVTLDDTLSAVSLIRYPHLDDYPPVKVGPDGSRLSFEDHEDVSIITVLFQSPVANLQVESPAGWLDVPTSASDFLINCGTYMAHLTNGYYRAPVHRVKWVNAERLSLPFFVHAGEGTTLEPFEPAGATGEGGNRPIRYGDYLQHGLQSLIDKNGQT
jgi:isopenicillin-N synthase